MTGYKMIWKNSITMYKNHPVLSCSFEKQKSSILLDFKYISIRKDYFMTLTF